MVLSVNSSTKIFLGFTAVAALGLGTVLFYRYRGNAVVQQEAPSLDKGRLSLANIPLIGSVDKTANLPIYTLGSPSNRFTTVDELGVALSKANKDHQHNRVLVIYGDNLNIIQDPGILLLKPMKVILVGVQIVLSFDADSLEHLMVKNGWHLDTFDAVKVVEVDSVEEAVKAALAVNPVTSKPYPTVYSVRA